MNVSCSRFSWTAICLTGDSDGEIPHEQDRACENLVVIAIQLPDAARDRPRRSVECRPRHEKRYGLKQTPISFRIAKGVLLCIEVIKVR